MTDLEEHYDTKFVIVKNGIDISHPTKDRSKQIFVIIPEENEVVEMDSKTGRLNLKDLYCDVTFVMKNSDFSKSLEEEHQHEIDMLCSQLYPFDNVEGYNMCQFDKSKFSSVKTLQRIKTNAILSRMKHHPSEYLMKIKWLSKVSSNYGYLENGLQEEFFLQFISEYYHIFQQEVNTHGFKKSVCEIFH